MIAAHVLCDGTATTYGLGLMHVTRGGLALIGHTGSTMGFRGEVFVHRDSGVCVAVLTNNFLSDAKKLTEPVWTKLEAELGL